MDEEKKAERTIEKTAATDTETRDKPKATSIVEQANLAAERMEAANAKMEELVNRQEEATAKQMLGGRSEAGQPPVEKEETPADFKNKFMKGEVEFPK